jgi:hypothetical protein
MQNEQLQPAQAELPKRNPPHVRVICDKYLEIVHGFTNGMVVATVEPEIGARDNNGLDIWVHSPNQQRDVWLSSNHYELLKPEEVQL